MSPLWDTTIVGAGAAGLMAAVQAARAGLRVLLLDSKEKIGAKILMSGGTRCNVTNAKTSERDFESENKTFVRHALAAFTEREAVKFFNELGVEVVLEAGGKYFPSTHSGRTILEAFLKEIKRLGVSLEAGRKVTEIRRHPRTVLGGDQRMDSSLSTTKKADPSSGGKGCGSGMFFMISGKNFSFESKTVALTTGGLSYPSSGSDGTGYGIAKSFGHTIIPTTPALTPFTTDDPDWKDLSGVTLPVRLSLFVNGRKKVEYEDSFLFTHFGFSGPAVLNISRHWIREPSNCKELVANFLGDKLPRRLAKTLLKKSQNIFHCPLSITGAVGYQKAEVTAGGVSLKEIDFRTLQSKIRPGLFFAGEILDADGRIGGFNFQWAWSTGVVAARGLAKKCLKG